MLKEFGISDEVIFIAIGGLVFLAIFAAIAAYLYWRKINENNGIETGFSTYDSESEPVETPLESIEEEPFEDEEEEDKYPQLIIEIWRWIDTLRTKVEHIVITGASHSGYEFAEGKLTFAWQNDGRIKIDSDRPADEGDEELYSDDDEKQRAWTRVFHWTQRLITEEPDTSDDAPANDWEPTNLVCITLEDGTRVQLEFDAYDELKGLTPDFVLESACNGLIRITDDSGVHIIDTDDVSVVIGYGFVEEFKLD